MSRLAVELQRLYFLAGQQADETAENAATLALLGADGMTRTLTVGFERAADWESAAKLYQGVQEDFDFPAPAISVSGKDGYRVWFSLAAPVPVEEARGFLKGLQLKYLADLPPARLAFHPSLDGPAEPNRLDLPPGLHGETGKWSAFIDPAMGCMFADEPGLEMAPNPDKQADLLAGFASIKAGDFQRVLKILPADAGPADSPMAPPATSNSEAIGREQPKLDVGDNFSDPKRFLLAVMNDPSASASIRIEAAKALLPYFEKPCT